MPEILYQKYFLKELDSCLVLTDTEDTLLLWDKNFLDDTIGRSIWYQKVSQNRFQRKEILVDFSGDFYFQLQEQLFEVLDEKYGLVESERSLSTFTYRDHSISVPLDFTIQNKFQLLEEMKSLRNADKQGEKAYFRTPGEYGVDTVLDEKFGKYFLSSSQPFMDSYMLQKEEYDKNSMRK